MKTTFTDCFHWKRAWQRPQIFIVSTLPKYSNCTIVQLTWKIVLIKQPFAIEERPPILITDYDDDTDNEFMDNPYEEGGNGKKNKYKNVKKLSKKSRNKKKYRNKKKSRKTRNKKKSRKCNASNIVNFKW